MTALADFGHANGATHQRRFMGAGHKGLVLYTFGGRAWVSAVGTLDPMCWHVDRAYRRGGCAAQPAFRGPGGERLRLLHQLAGWIA